MVVRIDFVYTAATLRVQNIFPGKNIAELRFANQTLKLVRIAALKIVNE